VTTAQPVCVAMIGTGFMGAAHGQGLPGHGQALPGHGQGLAGLDRLEGGPEALAFVREHAIGAPAAAFDAAFSVHKENTDD
jgi:hypothetical protein